MKTLRARIQSVVALGLGVALSGCGSSDSSYSILATGQNFKEATVNSQIDILWAVDNSGSMQPLQQNMTSNFNSFMSQISSKNFDFHIAVTSSEAYKAGSKFANSEAFSRFSDGVTSHTNVYDIMLGLSNMINTFVTNASLGSNGSGDERIFSSFKAALDDPQNAGFLRPKSFFAIIILSDEDDFSNPNRVENSQIYPTNDPRYAKDHDYANPGLETVDSYVAYLDGLTGTTGATRRYSVSAITVLDNACMTQHFAQSSSTIVGQRYMDMANKTGGELGSICDVSYANALNAIQQRILEQGTQFYLANKPVVTSIKVSVNGNQVPQDNTNGWSYNADANSVMFHGTAVPAAGASISVTFDPQQLTF